MKCLEGGAAVYLLTGAAGFLGSEVARLLLEQGLAVRALVLPGDPLAAKLPPQVDIITGDLLNPQDLDRFFVVPEGEPLTLIHCASLITMSMAPVPRVYQVNVEGTRNLVERCLKAGAGMIHVGSVHAIREKPHGQVMAEPESVSPDNVVGYYAKTKAEAVALVLQARQQRGLRASVVYPAGLTGPGDYARGNLTQLFLDYLAGKITVGVKGGYNFADVRDVARAIVTLAARGNLGEDYVLAGEFISILDILKVFHEVTGGRRVTATVPVWLARAVLPLMGLVYKIRGVKPIFSAYSLYTVGANSHFDSGKARRDLGYQSRPIRETLADTARWLLAREKG